LFSYIKQNYLQRICDQRYFTLYLFIIVAFLLLDVTNADTTNTTDVKEGFRDKLKDAVNNLLENLNLRSSDNLTTTANDSSVENATSIFHKPKNMSDVRTIFLAFLRLVAQIFIIVSC